MVNVPTKQPVSVPTETRSLEKDTRLEDRLFDRFDVKIGESEPKTTPTSQDSDL